MPIWVLLMIKAVIAAMTICPASVTAGAWDQFDRHCLTPLAATTLSQPADLVEMSRYKNDGDTFTNYALDNGAVLSVSDGRADYAKWCTLLSETDVALIVTEYENWVAHPDPDHAYVPLQAADFEVGSSGLAPVEQTGVTTRGVRSTDWREPRLDVIMSLPDSGAWVEIFVRDTDLES